ncbi:hypothetical protein Tco_0285979 [Tanacetum coccineum]
MMQEIDGEFKFLLEGCINDNQGSPSSKSVNNEAPVIDAKPLTSLHPSNFVEDVVDSDDASTGDNENPLLGTSLPPLPEAGKKLRSLGKRKLPSRVRDSLPKNRTQELISALYKATASYDVIRARELEKDRAYTELERKCNKALLNLNKNPLVADMGTEIETLQGRVDGLHSECTRLRERLKVSKIQLLQEMDALKQDRVRSLPKCAAFEEVAKLKESFVMEKMAGYRPSSKQEYDQAGDDLANASYPFLSKYVNDPYASLEQLLSKKLECLRSKPSSANVFDFEGIIRGPSSSLRRFILLDNVFDFEGLTCGPSSPFHRFILLDNMNLGTIQLSLSSLTTLVISFSATDLVCMTLTKTSFASYEKLGKLDQKPIVFSRYAQPSYGASYSASLLVVSNSNLIAYVYSFPSGFTNIGPAPELSELESPSVNSFHVISGSGSFLLASLFFSSSLFVGDVSARKSASICPLIEFLPLNSISSSELPCGVHEGKVFMKGRDFSALFERNLFRAANYLLKLCISLTVFGGCRADMAFTLEGSALMPCFVIRLREYIPSSTPKEHFLRLSFRLIARSLLRVSSMSANISSSESLFKPKGSLL